MTVPEIQSDIDNIFCHLIPKIKNLKKKMKKMSGNIILLQIHVYHKCRSYDIWFLKYKVRQTEVLVILGHFLPFYPPCPPLSPPPTLVPLPIYIKNIKYNYMNLTKKLLIWSLMLSQLTPISLTVKNLAHTFFKIILPFIETKQKKMNKLC